MFEQTDFEGWLSHIVYSACAFLLMICVACPMTSFACGAGKARLAGVPDHTYFLWQPSNGDADKAQATSEKQDAFAARLPVQGAFVELAKALFEPLDIQSTFDQALLWARAIDEVKSGVLDVAIGVVRSEDDSALHFLKPVIGVAESNVFVAANSQLSFEGWSSLEPLIGGALEGEQWGGAFDTFAERHLQLQRVRGRHQNIEKLRLGRIDYFIDREAPIAQYLSENSQTKHIKPLAQKLLKLPLYVVISKASACYAQRDALETQLESLIATGQWLTIQTQAQKQWVEAGSP